MDPIMMTHHNASRSGGHPRTWIRIAAVVAALGGLLLTTGEALAQDSAAAEALFRAGRAEMEKKNYEIACARFAESLHLEPTLGTRLNLANCEEKRGKIASAWQHYDAVARQVPKADPRHKYASERAKALKPRVPTLEFRLDPLAPANTQVRRGRYVTTQKAFRVPLPADPGKTKLVVEAEGFQPQTYEIELEEGEHRVMEVSPGPELTSSSSLASGAEPNASDGDKSAPEADKAPVEKSGPKASPWSYVLAGAGVGGIGGAVVLDRMARDLETELATTCAPDCDVAEVDKVDRRHRFATVSLALGLTSLAGGVFWFFSSSSRSQASASGPKTTLRVSTGPGAGGVELVGTFH